MQRLRKRGASFGLASKGFSNVDVFFIFFMRTFHSTNEGVVRNNLESWVNWKVDQRGIMLDGNLLHCEGAWRVRGLPKLRKAFATIWNDEDLICSFDSTLLWRPWGKNKLFKPRVGEF
jgi:hypothetical protein